MRKAEKGAGESMKYPAGSCFALQLNGKGNCIMRPSRRLENATNKPFKFLEIETLRRLVE